MKFTKIAALSTALVFMSGLANAQKESTQSMATPQQVQSEKEVSEKELNQFAESFSAVQEMNQGAQKKMMALLEEHGVSPQQFGQMRQNNMDPNSETEMSEEEKAQFAALNTALEKVQQEIQNEMIEEIESTGISVERYQEIASQLQSDVELQEKLQAKMAEE